MGRPDDVGYQQLVTAILCRNQRILSIKFYSARLFKTTKDLKNH